MPLNVTVCDRLWCVKSSSHEKWNLTVASVIVYFTRSQASKCHAVLTTGLFGRHCCLGTHGTSLDLISKPAWLIPLTCVVRQTDRASVCTNAPFAWPGMDPQVTNICQIYQCGGGGTWIKVVASLKPLKLVGNCMYHHDWHSHVLHDAECFYKFFTNATTNSDYFPIQHSLICCYEWDVCLLRGTNCIILIQANISL